MTHRTAHGRRMRLLREFQMGTTRGLGIGGTILVIAVVLYRASLAR